MELISWSDKYTTGIAGVDSEHAELIATINRFYSGLAHSVDKNELINILNDIYGAIHAHFMLEENIMRKHGYDEYEQHKRDHARLLDDLRDIALNLEHSADYDELQLKKILSEWFLVHFKTHDARLHKLEQLIAQNKQSSNSLGSLLKKLKTRISSK